MATAITSLRNPRIKRALALRRRSGRQEQKCIVIDGVREISRALTAGIELTEVFACPELCDEPAARLIAAIRDRGVALLTVTPTVFQKLAFGKRAEGLVAAAREPAYGLEDIALRDDSLIAVLEGVEKPGNLGAVVRSADAAGLDALIVADGRTDLYNPNAIRASLGAIFTLRTAAASTARTLAWLRAHRVPVFAARVDAPVQYTDVSYQGRCAIAVGSEAEGLSELWRGDGVQAVSVPMLGDVDSLNVAAAAAVLFYEALRQRSATKPSGAGL